ncbi:MAG: response regulator [Rubrivivax sp.]
MGLDPAAHRSVELLRSSAQSLTMMLNDVLDFAKIESGHLALKMAPFDLAACTREAFALFEPLARDRGLRLELTVDAGLPRLVRGDATRLRQVLLNLLSNAIKFTDVGSVTMLVERAEPSRVDGPDRAGQNGGAAAAPGSYMAARFAVIDSGIGIAADHQSQLFQAFSQVDSSMRRRHGGTGLGLAISQQLVGLMGARIGVRSEPNRGSTFEFTVAWEVIADTPYPSHPEPVLDARFGHDRPLRILLVEDNPVNQLVAQQMLSRLGYQVETVNNGEDAVQAQRRSPHDLVLMDIQMPGIDGIEACRRIRALPTTHTTHIVALTANASESDRQAYRAAGMDSHLPKPFELRDLAQVLDQAFQAATSRSKPAH